MLCVYYMFICFFFNDTATTEIYTYCHTLSLHDALPIFEVVIENAVRVEAVRVLVGIGVEHRRMGQQTHDRPRGNHTFVGCSLGDGVVAGRFARSEEHTSELQSLMRNSYAVFCLKKKTKQHLNQTLRTQINEPEDR